MLHRHSVAEHGWMVGMVSMLVFEKIKFLCNRDEINYLKLHEAELLKKALLHDVEECVTGDLPRKEITRKQTKIYKDSVGYEVVKELFNCEGLDVTLPEIWKNSKKDYTGIIVASADIICAFIEAISEKHLGSSDFNEKIPYLIQLFISLFNRIDWDNITEVHCEVVKYTHDVIYEIYMGMHRYVTVELGLVVPRYETMV